MSNLQAALVYHAAGLSIFPCKPGTRDPHVKWKELQTKRATVAEIKAWWTQWPHAGIALVTGKISGVVVVDVDKQHGGTAEGLPVPLAMAKTPGGGTHFFYSYPPGANQIRNQVNGEDSPDPDRIGRDVRADGGFVLLSPSIRESGRRYAWTDNASDVVTEREQSIECIRVFATSIVRTDIVQMPPSWALNPLRKEEDPNADKDSLWISRALTEGAKEGERNTTVAKLAGFYESKGLATDIAVATLQAWNKAQPPAQQLPAEEIEVTVRSVYKTAYRNKPISEKKIDRSLFEVLSMPEYMERYGSQDVQWAIEDWLPASTIAMVVAPPGSYKTWLTFDCMVSIASGRPFMDQYPVGHGCQGPIIIVQQEDFHGQIAERMSVIAMHKYGIRVADCDDAELIEIRGAPDCPIYFYPHRDLRFNDLRKMDAFEEWISRIKPKAMLFDPLYSGSKSLESYMAEDITDMMRFKTWRDNYGMSSMFVHHSKKGTESFNRERGWGSQFLNAFCETVWGVAKNDNDERQVVVKPNFKIAPAGSLTAIDFDIHTDTRWSYKATARRISEEESDAMLHASNVTHTGMKNLLTSVMSQLAKGAASVAQLSERCNTTVATMGSFLATQTRKGIVRASDNGTTYELVARVTFDD